MTMPLSKTLERIVSISQFQKRSQPYIRYKKKKTTETNKLWNVGRTRYSFTIGFGFKNRDHWFRDGGGPRKTPTSHLHLLHYSLLTTLFDSSISPFQQLKRTCEAGIGVSHVRGVNEPRLSEVVDLREVPDLVGSWGEQLADADRKDGEVLLPS